MHTYVRSYVHTGSVRHFNAAAHRQDTGGSLWVPLQEPTYWLRRCTGNTARYDERCAEIHGALRQAIGAEARAARVARCYAMRAHVHFSRLVSVERRSSETGWASPLPSSPRCAPRWA
jgi:hypothetical protein